VPGSSEVAITSLRTTVLDTARGLFRSAFRQEDTGLIRTSITHLGRVGVGPKMYSSRQQESPPVANEMSRGVTHPSIAWMEPTKESIRRLRRGAFVSRKRTILSVQLMGEIDCRVRCVFSRAFPTFSCRHSSWSLAKVP